MTEAKILTNVYQFQNGMVMAFDQFGEQMPEYQGKAEKVIPKIRMAGYSKPIEIRSWR